jgi:hypothetical protein
LSRTEDKAKLRDHRKPGWFWAENETFDVFQPFIGPLGVAVYLALCREARSTEVRVALRDIEPLAGVKKDTVRRSIIRMEALKMIRVKRGGTATSPATYELLDLKAAAGLGTNELARLLAVAERDKLKTKVPAKSAKDADAVVAQGDNSAEATIADSSATTLSQKGPKLSQNEEESSLNCDNLLNRKTDEDFNTSPQPPGGGLDTKGEESHDGEAGTDVPGGRRVAAGGADGGAVDAAIDQRESGTSRRASGGNDAGSGVQASLRLVGRGSSPHAARGGALDLVPPARQRRTTAAEQRAMVGAAPAQAERVGSDSLSSFDVKMRFQAAVTEVHDGLQSELAVTGAASLVELILNPVAQWDAATDGLAYDRHEVPEGSDRGIALVLAAKEPKAAERVLQANSGRMSAALGRHFGCRVQVQLIAQDGAA